MAGGGKGQEKHFEIYHTLSTGERLRQKHSNHAVEEKLRSAFLLDPSADEQISYNGTLLDTLNQSEEGKHHIKCDLNRAMPGTSSWSCKLYARLQCSLTSSRHCASEGTEKRILRLKGWKCLSTKSCG